LGNVNVGRGSGSVSGSGVHVRDVNGGMDALQMIDGGVKKDRIMSGTDDMICEKDRIMLIMVFIFIISLFVIILFFFLNFFFFYYDYLIR
jgi:hypothetical protein